MGLTPRIMDSEGLGWIPRTYISNNFPSMVKLAVWDHALRTTILIEDARLCIEDLPGSLYQASREVCDCSLCLSSPLQVMGQVCGIKEQEGQHGLVIV